MALKGVFSVPFSGLKVHGNPGSFKNHRFHAVPLQGLALGFSIPWAFWTL